MGNLMALMRRYSIRFRMVGAIAAVLGMFAVVGPVGLVGGLRINSLNETFTQRSVRSLETVGQVRQQLTQVRLLEQSSGLGQVNVSVGELDRMTQQNAALVEQSAAAAESLKEQAARLGALVGTFRLGDTATHTHAAHP